MKQSSKNPSLYSETRTPSGDIMEIVLKNKKSKKNSRAFVKNPGTYDFLSSAHWTLNILTCFKKFEHFMYFFVIFLSMLTLYTLYDIINVFL